MRALLWNVGVVCSSRCFVFFFLLPPASAVTCKMLLEKKAAVQHKVLFSLLASAQQEGRWFTASFNNYLFKRLCFSSLESVCLFSRMLLDNDHPTSVDIILRQESRRSFLFDRIIDTCITLSSWKTNNNYAGAHTVQMLCLDP